MLLRVLVCACLCASLAEGQQPEEPLDAAGLQGLLDQVEEALGGIRTLRTDFVQEKHLMMFDEVVRSEGVCVFERPDRVRFEITSPFQSLLLSADGRAAKYERLDGRWQRLELPHPDAVLAVTRQIAAWMGGDFQQQQELYQLSGFAGEQPRLVLVPRAEGLRKRLSAIEVLFDAELQRIEQVILREPGDDFTRLSFGAEVRDAPLDGALFDTSRATPAMLD